MASGEPAASPAEPVAAAPRPAVDGPSILVVEDTPVNQTVARRMLARLGYRVDLARDGNEAIAAVSARSFAAVLMDCQMPVLDGYEATREIRRREAGGPRTPIIAMTASSMAGDRERCLAAGMDDYLSKPLRPRQLEAALDRWAPRPAAGVVIDEAILAGLDALDAAAFDELKTMYLEEAGAGLAALRSAVENEDADAIARSAHRLRGSSSTLGAVMVANLAGDLERRAKSGDLVGAGLLVDRLASSLDDTREAFVLRIAQNAGPDRS
jgi:two-component system sensor histidine kinase/response regulator